MKRVTGIGGVFFKADDPKALNEWYSKNLGVPLQHGFAQFSWKDKDNPEQEGSTSWSTFPKDTKYFGSGQQTFMINYRVENLDVLLEELAAAGVTIDPKREEYDYGKFAWIVDPEGNRIELWEPKE